VPYGAGSFCRSVRRTVLVRSRIRTRRAQRYPLVAAGEKKSGDQQKSRVNTTSFICTEVRFSSRRFTFEELDTWLYFGGTGGGCVCRCCASCTFFFGTKPRWVSGVDATLSTFQFDDTFFSSPQRFSIAITYLTSKKWYGFTTTARFRAHALLGRFRCNNNET
jgi:hypothetical protein